MTRYIDADKFKQQLESAIEKLHLIGGIKGVDVGAVIKAIDMQPTADVVPRSEYDALLHKYELAVAEREANVKGFSEMLHKQKIDLAKEIFQEISKISVPAILPTVKIDWQAFMELRTRYTKEEL